MVGPQRSERRRVVAWLALALAGALAMAGAPSRAVAADPLYVVMSTQSTVRSLEAKDVLALFTGRTRALPNGELATPIDQPRDSAARAAFYQALTGMDIARINSYWARLHFTGQVQPPLAVPDDQAVIQRVRNDPSAVGYLTREPSDPSLRVLLRLR